VRIDQLKLLFEHSTWARDRLLDRAGRVSAEQFDAPGPVPHGTLRNTLVHMMSSEWAWRMRCQESFSPTAHLAPADFPDMAAVRRRWDEERDRMGGYLAGLADGDLEKPIHYQTMEGEPRERPLWHILTHVMLHGAQHRSEAAALLTGYGQSPGDLDFVVYLTMRQR
jgi:uncharacterized damage-inducible protein DinB